MVSTSLTEEQTRIKREKAKQAVALAMEGCWQEALEANKAILSICPQDVEALNRLGKALSELGRHSEAREAFQTALNACPTNAIARKNLERLSYLKDDSAGPRHRERVVPQLFIEDSGKSTVTSLTKVAPSHMLAKVAAADPVTLKLHDRTVIVETLGEERLGEIEPRLTLRLTRLINGGNRYTAAVKSVGENAATIIIREAYQAPALAGVVSFPCKSNGSQRFLPYEEMTIETKDELQEGEVPDQWGDGQEESGKVDLKSAGHRTQDARTLQEAEEDEDEEEDED